MGDSQLAGRHRLLFRTPRSPDCRCPLDALAWGHRWERVGRRLVCGRCGDVSLFRFLRLQQIADAPRARGNAALLHKSRCGQESRLAPAAIIQSSRRRASRAPSWCSESCIRPSPRLAVTQALSLASRGPRWTCNDRMSSRPCSVCCNPIQCATCVCQAALSPECCGRVPACLPTPMRAGHPFVEKSAPLANDRLDDR